jgi:hypothetical protein
MFDLGAPRVLFTVPSGAGRTLYAFVAAFQAILDRNVVD